MMRIKRDGRRSYIRPGVCLPAVGLVSLFGCLAVTNRNTPPAKHHQATLDERTSGIQFRGRFAIVRTVKIGDNTEVSLYIGDGSELSYGFKPMLDFHALFGKDCYACPEWVFWHNRYS